MNANHGFFDVTERSLAIIDGEDLVKLSNIADIDLNNYIFRNPANRSAFKTRKLCTALCQGAARHFVDKKNGVKDFDVYGFFRADEASVYPPRRRGVYDFGLSKFGRHPDDVGYAGRRVDVMGRSIVSLENISPVEAIRHYLTTKPTTTAWHLAQKAVVLIEPPELRGTVVWFEREGPFP